MARLSELDFPDRLAPAVPLWAGQLLWAFSCTAAPIVARRFVDIIFVGAGPYSLVAPAVMIATLFGRWQAGLATLIASVLYVWYAVLPAPNSFHFDVADDLPRTIVNFLTLSAIVLLSEIFRRAARTAVFERDRQIVGRDLLIAEFEHRVRNNFASVTGLLQLQLQHAENEETAEALRAAIGRVESIARANRYLFDSGNAIDRIVMPIYLGELCNALNEALFEQSPVSLDCSSTDETIANDKAVAIGLIVNELVTNAAKHAFPDGRDGAISVRFERADPGHRLIVEDNGVGIDGPPRPGSLGHRLMDALVKQVGGELDTDSDERGTRITLTMTAT